MSLSDHHPLDDVAKELASGPISRGRALKLLGTALAGSVLALIPGVASASPPPHANAGGRSDLAPPSHARDQQGFEPGTGGRFGSGQPSPICTGTCSITPPKCPPGCQCIFIENTRGGGVFQCQ
jgi:hypothetical protein